MLTTLPSAIMCSFTNISTATPGACVGAAHQTGWTGLVALLLQQQDAVVAVQPIEPIAAAPARLLDAAE
jgi:hypothetical protein